jgi:hypothetical protein
MKNLEQIRASHAMQHSDNNSYQGANGGDAIAKKTPARIRANGLLAAAAYAYDKRGGDLDLFIKAIIPHLRATNKTTQKELRPFIEELSNGSSENLRAVTAEALAYLNYLRRFAQ